MVQNFISPSAFSQTSVPHCLLGASLSALDVYMVLPEPQNSLCAILLMKSQPQMIFCPCKSTAQGGCSCIASCLLALRSLFWHRGSQEQLQRSRDGPAIASWRDEHGNKCQEKEIVSHVLCPGHVLVGKGWQVAPIPPMEDGSSFFFAKCPFKQNCHKYFHTWLLTSASAQVWSLCHTSHSAAFEDFLQKLHFSRNIHFCSSAEEVKTVPHKPGHWEMTIPNPDHSLCPLCT